MWIEYVGYIAIYTNQLHHPTNDKWQFAEEEKNDNPCDEEAKYMYVYDTTHVYVICTVHTNARRHTDIKIVYSLLAAISDTRNQ